MTPLARGILTSAKLGVANFAKYFMSNLDTFRGVTVADHATLDMTNDFAGCAFVYPKNRFDTQRIMSKFTQSGNQRSWGLGINTSGNIIFNHSVDGIVNTTFASTVDVPMDTLSLVHFRLTGGNVYVGINGASEQSTAKGACFSGSGVVEIGTIDLTIYSNDLDVTQPMLFNSPSSLANFATIYNGGMPCKYSLIDTAITDDAVMAFELSSNDDTVTDLSTAGNNGAFVGGSFVNGQPVTWKIGPEFTTAVYNSFGFNNTDYINSGNGATLQITGNITVAIWVKDSVASKIFFSKYSFSDNQRAWNLRSESGVYKFFVSSGGTSTTTVSSTTASNSDTWKHLVGVYDGTDIHIYINGVLENSTTYSSGIHNSTTSVSIGDYGGPNIGAGSMVGSATQPMIFNSALSSVEVASLYGAGNRVITFDELTSGVQSKAAMAYAANSNDDSLNDLSVNSNNGTAQNSATADGDTQTYII
jgi:hypothetical protein